MKNYWHEFLMIVLIVYLAGVVGVIVGHSLQN